LVRIDFEEPVLETLHWKKQLIAPVGSAVGGGNLLVGLPVVHFAVELIALS